MIKCLSSLLPDRPAAGRPWPAQDQVWQDHEESSQEDRQQREGAGGHLHHGGQHRGRGQN